MLQSKFFFKTKKEISKKEVAISSRLLLKADFIERSSAGVWRFLPFGFRVLKKIEKIIREEMENLGAQEILLPAIQNKKLWQESGRWDKIEPPLFKFKDRLQREFALGPTHEEEIVDIVRKRISSFRDLPLALFQIQTKFRNELRFQAGLLRTREFLMKDLYSFHSDKKDLQRFYQKVIKSYFKIFKRCNLKPILVEASSGPMGGQISHEFMVESQSGEDKIALCKNCNFASNLEKIHFSKACPFCKKELLIKNSIEIGHIFMLEDFYSKKMKAFFRKKNGKLSPIYMGCYGIGLGRLMGAIVEIHHDQNGIIWPKEIAPFEIHLLEIESKNKKLKKISRKIYQNLKLKNFEVLYDEREDKSGGEKLVESDLIGIPLRIVVSEKLMEKNLIEVKKRDQKKAKFFKISEFLSKIKK